MNIIEAIILGILQGLTEFFPVSSSGHLKLGQWLFGYNNLENYLFFDLICHLGTLLAILLSFSHEIKELFLSKQKTLFQLILATLPLFILAAIIKPIKAICSTPLFLGPFFLTTALLLFLAIRFGHTQSQVNLYKRRFKDALIIGSMQTVAVLPGISRSGSTLAAARLLGWSKEDAFTFSFLLAIPTILGGVAFEMILSSSTFFSLNSPVSLSCYFAGFLSSFITGFFALFCAKQLFNNEKFLYFVWYCLALGLITSFFFTVQLLGN